MRLHYRNINDTVITNVNLFVNEGPVNIASPRLIREVSPPLGLYFRSGLNDHWELLKLLAEGHRGLSGLVFDPTLDKRQEELRKQTLRRGLDSILDTRAMELATPSGFTGVRTDLVWAGRQQHRPSDLGSEFGRHMVALIADHAEQRHYTAVLAPSHYLTSPNDPWLPIDRELTLETRRRLPQSGSARVALYYPLAVPGKVLRDPEQRSALKHYLKTLPIDALWLRINGFGNEVRSVALAGYIEACRDLNELGLPIVAEKSGTVGLALLAFDAVGGIESGVTIGERCDISHWLREPNGDGGFAAGPRVYIADLQLMLKREQARESLAARGARSFACKEPTCCRHGHVDMIGTPRRHFLITRMSEVAQMGKVAPEARPSIYLDDVLRPATDRMMRALRYPLSEGTRGRLERRYDTLESWRQTLGQLARSASPESSARTSHRHIQAVVRQGQS